MPRYKCNGGVCSQCTDNQWVNALCPHTEPTCNNSCIPPPPPPLRYKCTQSGCSQCLPPTSTSVASQMEYQMTCPHTEPTCKMGNYRCGCHPQISPQIMRARYGSGRGKGRGLSQSNRRSEYLNAVGDLCYGGGFCFGREDDEGRCQPCASHPWNIASPVGRAPSRGMARSRRKGRGLRHKGFGG